MIRSQDWAEVGRTLYNKGVSVEIRVEYMNFEEIAKWPRNPKDHDLEEIKKSFGRFGFVKPILVDEGSSQLVAGHGRVDSLKGIKKEGKDPPRGVKVENGNWLIPVLRGVKFENTKEAEAYLLADNRLGEIGGWNQDMLAEIVNELSADDLLEGIGFSVESMDYDFASLDKELEELSGIEDSTVPIVVPKKYKEKVSKWLCHGETNTGAGRGRGVLIRMGIL